jgi:hypothetical protein
VNAIIFSAADGVDPSIIQENDLNNTSIFQKKWRREITPPIHTGF